MILKLDSCRMRSWMCKYRERECPGRGHMYKGPVVESSLAALDYKKASGLHAVDKRPR